MLKPRFAQNTLKLLVHSRIKIKESYFNPFGKKKNPGKKCFLLKNISRFILSQKDEDQLDSI